MEVTGGSSTKTSISVPSTSDHYPGSGHKLTLLALPTELVLHILSQVHWSDYYSVRHTSRLLKVLADDPNGLAASRYHFTPPIPPASAISLSRPFKPVKIHQLISCASYQVGVPSVSVCVPAPDKTGHFRSITHTIPVKYTPFWRDAFSEPTCDKIVISWAHVQVMKAAADAGNAPGLHRFAFAPQQRALYVNNLIVGTGGKLGSPSRGLDTNIRKYQDASDRGCFITVADIFSAFERDHPDLRTKLGGRAEVVEVNHIFYPYALAAGGSHFEVKWTWIEDTE